MNPLTIIREKAKKQLRRIILPESNDERVIEAASHIVRDGIAEILLLGNVEETKKGLAKFGPYPESLLEVVNPTEGEIFEKMLARFCDKRKGKDADKETYRKLLSENSTYIAALMTDTGIADGFVAGASHKTSEVAKAALYCLGVDELIGVASGAFVMYIEGSSYGDDGLFLFADCGLVPDPTPRQLAGIALSSGRLYKKLFGREPHVAMLSYSTKSSAHGPLVEKVKRAVDEVKRLEPNLLVDGELQADSALDPSVAQKKTSIKDSPVAGKANVLVFPNLDSGNISYKLVQRLAGARAVGPLMQGLKKPCSDLSRGCDVDDVIDAVAVTAVRAGE